MVLLGVPLPPSCRPPTDPKRRASLAIWHLLDLLEERFECPPVDPEDRSTWVTTGPHPSGGRTGREIRRFLACLLGDLVYVLHHGHLAGHAGGFTAVTCALTEWITDAECPGHEPKDAFSLWPLAAPVAPPETEPARRAFVAQQNLHELLRSWIGIPDGSDEALDEGTSELLMFLLQALAGVAHTGYLSGFTRGANEGLGEVAFWLAHCVTGAIMAAQDGGDGGGFGKHGGRLHLHDDAPRD